MLSVFKICIFARLNHFDKLYILTFERKRYVLLTWYKQSEFRAWSTKKSARFSSLIIHFLNVSFLQKTFKSKYVSDLKVMASVNLFTRLCLTWFGVNRFLSYSDYVRVGLTTITLVTPRRTVTSPLQTGDSLTLPKGEWRVTWTQVPQIGIFTNVCWQSHQMSKCAYK